MIPGEKELSVSFRVMKKQWLKRMPGNELGAEHKHSNHCKSPLFPTAYMTI